MDDKPFVTETNWIDALDKIIQAHELRIGQHDEFIIEMRDILKQIQDAQRNVEIKVATRVSNEISQRVTKHMVRLAVRYYRQLTRKRWWQIWK